MSDTTYTLLSIVTTTNGNLSNLSITNGQLILVRDSRKLYFDYDDKRVAYGPIVDLATEAERTSILAPVTGSFYYVVETNILWTYRGSWVKITDISSLSDHMADESNPHNVTVDQIGAISYFSQSLTDEQKVQARTNIGAGTSDVTSWNELDDKPFGELPTGSDTLYWDGNREGLVRADDYEQYLISESTPTLDDFANGASNTKLDGDTETSTNLGLNTSIYEVGDGAIVVGNSIVALKDGATVGDTIYPKKGTYFTWIGNDCYTTSLTIPGYSGFPSSKLLDEKWLPKHNHQIGTIPVTTAGTGAAYTASVDGITELETGLSFILIPHTNSTSTTATLNVNGLGAKYIRQRLSTNISATAAGYAANWLVANKPIAIIYNGTYWVAELTRPDANTIYGTVPVANGGVPTSTTSENGKVLGVVDGDPAWVDEQDVTAEIIASALGYTPADAEDLSQLSQSIPSEGSYVKTNQGSANVGKILVVGADGNLTLTDMPETMSGDVVGALDENNNIVITGDLADGTYTFKYENTDGTYADIGSLTIGEETVNYSITNTLSYITNSNSAATVEEGSSYAATLTPDSGYQISSVVITMGGADVTSTVYSNGSISISSVTGDIVITAAAVAIPTGPAYTNIIDTVGYTNDTRVSTSSGELRTGATGYTSTGIIDLTPYAKPRVLRTKGVDFRHANYNYCAIAFFSDANGTFSKGYSLASGSGIIGHGDSTVDAEGNMTLSGGNFAGYDYVRFCGYGDGANLIVTVNEEITD